MTVISVSRTEFKTKDGRIFPIDPPLSREVTLSEFQEHYNTAAAFVRSLKVVGYDSTDLETVGRGGED